MRLIGFFLWHHRYESELGVATPRRTRMLWKTIPSVNSANHGSCHLLPVVRFPLLSLLSLYKWCHPLRSSKVRKDFCMFLWDLLKKPQIFQRMISNTIQSPHILDVCAMRKPGNLTHFRKRPCQLFAPPWIVTYFGDVTLLHPQELVCIDGTSSILWSDMNIRAWREKHRQVDRT